MDADGFTLVKGKRKAKKGKGNSKEPEPNDPPAEAGDQSKGEGKLSKQDNLPPPTGPCPEQGKEQTKDKSTKVKGGPPVAKAGDQKGNHPGSKSEQKGKKGPFLPGQSEPNLEATLSRILETLIPQAISKALAEHPQTQAQASSSGLPPVQQEQSPSPQLMQWQQPGAMWATPPFWYEGVPQALPTTTTGYYGCGVGYTPPTGPPLVMPTTWTSGSHQQKCPICKKFVGAGSSALRQHQLTSSMCRAAAGEYNSGREPCPYTAEKC